VLAEPLQAGEAIEFGHPQVEQHDVRLRLAHCGDDVATDRDLADAEGNLVRVLAIDEHAPSAWNQLALVHLAKAKRLGRKELELAMGVCLQATRSCRASPRAYRSARPPPAEPAGSTKVRLSGIEMMRAEMQAAADDIKKSLALLRRHL
jgi:hypothetical protein